MNYDHRFHAGNFADVFKHVVLTRILVYLKRKPAPFRIIDTHAGRGSYDLAAEVAARTQEWRDGVGRLDRAAFSPAAAELIAAYLDVAGAPAPRAAYPGSPLIASHLARPADRMLFCELHPAAAASLRSCVGRDRRAKVLALDGYVGLNAFVPPVERRGVVLIDPPFEAADEFGRLAEALVAAHAKWRDGILMGWYPIKQRRDPERLASRLAHAAPDVLRLELAVGTPTLEGPLVANGLIIVNPPYTLEAEMACLLPELHRQLDAGRDVDGGGDGGFWRIDRPAARRPETGRW